MKAYCKITEDIRPMVMELLRNAIDKYKEDPNDYMEKSEATYLLSHNISDIDMTDFRIAIICYRDILNIYLEDFMSGDIDYTNPDVIDTYIKFKEEINTISEESEKEANEILERMENDENYDPSEDDDYIKDEDDLENEVLEGEVVDTEE